MITELEKKIVCAVLNDKSGITDITKELFGIDVLKKNYEKVKNHLKILVSEGILEAIDKNYRIPAWVDVGDGIVTLQTSDEKIELHAGKTLFIKKIDETDQQTISVIFIDDLQQQPK